MYVCPYDCNITCALGNTSYDIITVQVTTLTTQLEEMWGVNDRLKVENDDLKVEVDGLKVEGDGLKVENTQLKVENQHLKVSNYTGV